MSDRNWPSSRFSAIRAPPADLVVVFALVVLTDIFVLAPIVSDTTIRTVLGLSLALFLPGYAFVAAMFPEAGPPATESDRSERSGGGRLLSARRIGGIERVLLSVGASIAIVPLIGLVLNVAPWGIRLVPVTLSVSAFTTVAVVLAAFRRWMLPAEERFVVPYRRWMGTARSAVLEPDTHVDAALNVFLVLSVLVLISSVVYAVTVPRADEQFTEFYLLTENDAGELVADGYPTRFARGEPKPLVVGVSNHERRPMDYTVVAELQRVDVENNTTTVIEQRQLRRFEIRADANATRLRRHTVAPTMTGPRLRLTYLLYRGSPPRNPTVENAYRETHLWINVSNERANERSDPSFSPSLTSSRNGSSPGKNDLQSGRLRSIRRYTP